MARASAVGLEELERLEVLEELELLEKLANKNDIHINLKLQDAKSYPRSLRTPQYR